MNKETMYVLNGRDGARAKQLLDFCLSPKTPMEVSNCSVKNSFDVLMKLINSGAIVFRDGKYVAVEG